MKPTIGRIVHYRTDGRNGLVYDLPAIITVTQDSHPGEYPDGAHNPVPVPESPLHVHLTVFTPGGFGAYPASKRGEDFKGADTIVTGSGTYVEWNVPFFDPLAAENRGPHDGQEQRMARTWRWPVIER